MKQDLETNKYCNCLISSNKKILETNTDYSFCEKCGSILLKDKKNNKIIYTIKPKQRQKPIELNPIDIIKSMKEKTEKDFPFLNNEYNMNDEEKNNKEELLKSIDIYLTYRKMIIVILQKMMKMLDFSDLCFYQSLFYIDNYLSHMIKEETTEKEIIYYVVGFFLSSSKFKESDIYEPSFDNFCSIKKKIYLSVERISQYEIKCLQIIGYNPFAYSAYDWVNELISFGFVFDCEIDKNNPIILIKGHRHSIVNVISKYAMKSLLEITVRKIFFKFSPMYIAFSLIHISREKYLDKNLINNELYFNLINLYSINFSDYEKCYSELKIDLEQIQNEKDTENKENDIKNNEERNKEEKRDLRYFKKGSTDFSLRGTNNSIFPINICKSSSSVLRLKGKVMPNKQLNSEDEEINNYNSSINIDKIKNKEIEIIKENNNIKENENDNIESVKNDKIDENSINNDNNDNKNENNIKNNNNNSINNKPNNNEENNLNDSLEYFKKFEKNNDSINCLKNDDENNYNINNEKKEDNKASNTNIDYNLDNNNDEIDINDNKGKIIDNNKIFNNNENKDININNNSKNNISNINKDCNNNVNNDHIKNKEENINNEIINPNTINNLKNNNNVINDYNNINNNNDNDSSNTKNIIKINIIKNDININKDNNKNISNNKVENNKNNSYNKEINNEDNTIKNINNEDYNTINEKKSRNNINIKTDVIEKEKNTNNKNDIIENKYIENNKIIDNDKNENKNKDIGDNKSANNNNQIKDILYNENNSNENSNNNIENKINEKNTSKKLEKCNNNINNNNKGNKKIITNYNDKESISNYIKNNNGYKANIKKRNIFKYSKFKNGALIDLLVNQNKILYKNNNILKYDMKLKENKNKLLNSDNVGYNRKNSKIRFYISCDINKNKSNDDNLSIKKNNQNNNNGIKIIENYSEKQVSPIHFQNKKSTKNLFLKTNYSNSKILNSIKSKNNINININGRISSKSNKRYKEFNFNDKNIKNWGNKEELELMKKYLSYEKNIFNKKKDIYSLKNKYKSKNNVPKINYFDTLLKSYENINQFKLNIIKPELKNYSSNSKRMYFKNNSNNYFIKDNKLLSKNRGNKSTNHIHKNNIKNNNINIPFIKNKDFNFDVKKNIFSARKKYN